jgi:hypothetical protein
MQLVEALLTQRILAFGTVAACDQIALDAIQLSTNGRIDNRTGVLIERAPSNFIFSSLVLDDLKAPLDLLGVQLSLMVHLGKSLKESLQRSNNEAILGEVAIQDVG